jgi:hypothetical protein
MKAIPTSFRVISPYYRLLGVCHLPLLIFTSTITANLKQLCSLPKVRGRIRTIVKEWILEIAQKPSSSFFHSFSFR